MGHFFDHPVMICPFLVQKFSQASKYLCPAKLQIRYDVCCVCQSVYPFVPSCFGTGKAVIEAKDRAWLCAGEGSTSLTPLFATGSLSLWE